MSNSVVLGVDIGGSHLTAALVSRDSKILVEGSRVRVHVNSSGTAEEILDTWSAAINAIFGKYNLPKKKIGIAMPGPFDYANGISLIHGLDKYDSLYNLNVKEKLAQLVGIPLSNILIANDAACFLRGEVYHGAARGFQNAIGITLGTGTGTAIHHRGNTEDANLGPSPFLDSIADEYFSTRWFVKRYAELSAKSVRDVRMLSQLYDSDRQVRSIFAEFAKTLSVFLRGFIERENPEIIVMGGNIAQSADLFLADLENHLRVAGVPVPIVRAQLGEEAAILGASSLFESYAIL